MAPCVNNGSEPAVATAPASADQGTGDAPFGFAMLQKDKVVLRNVVIAVVAGSLGAVAIGTSCLGRHPLAVPTEQATSTTNPGTTADNAGGVEPVGSTNITSTTIIVNPATSQPPPTPQPAPTTQQSRSNQSSQAEPAASEAPPPATTTVITQPAVRVATPQSAPPAPSAAETATAEAQQPAPAAADAGAAAANIPAAPIIIPIPAPAVETPSAGNVPSNPGIGSPQQGPYVPPAATPGLPAPNYPPNNLGQTRLPQGQLPVPRTPAGSPVPAPTTP